MQLRLPRDDVDGAGQRVAAEQRPLRPAQHFDVIDVEQIEVRAEKDRIIDVVHIEGDRILGT